MKEILRIGTKIILTHETSREPIAPPLSAQFAINITFPVSITMVSECPIEIAPPISVALFSLNMTIVLGNADVGEVTESV